MSVVGSSWAIATYARLRPLPVGLNQKIDHRVHAVDLTKDCHREILELDIPLDAEPGLLHYNSEGTLKFEFDKVFNSNTSQDDIFEEIAKDKIRDALDGVNCTIFAYGQTGSGKTFSICGGETYNDRGIIPRTIGYLFEQIRALHDNHRSLIFRCHVSFTEVYKESVYDLLDENKRFVPIEEWVPIQVMEGENGTFLRNVQVFEVENEEKALNLFFLGTANRLTGSTAMNQASSRSHAIFTVVIESEGIRDDKTILTTGKINLVDLAGSERMYKMNNTRQQISEAKSINLSLHYLEQVIICLRDQAKTNKPSHIPYRNSVLTSILRDSLGGNCRSCFLLTLSSEQQHFEETISSCRFGQRCGEVKVNVHANTEIGLGDQLRELSIRVKALERQIYVMEEQKKRLVSDLEQEKTLRTKQCEHRNLTPAEKDLCKNCIQGLFTAAKDVSTRTLSASTVNPNIDGTPPDESTPPDSSVQAAASSILEQSQELLYSSMESMDKAVLMELCIALGGLVQTLFLDRERLKHEEVQRQQRRLQLKAEKEAKLKVEMEREELRRRSEEESRQNQRSKKTLGMDITEEVMEILLRGATFIKHSRFGMKNVRYFWLTPDLLNICWRKIGNMQSQNTIPLKEFESVDIDNSDKDMSGKESCLITLHGKAGTKSIVLEYGSFETIEENRDAALIWVEALQKCIQRAKTIGK